MPRVAVLADLDLRGIDDAPEALVGVADSLEGFDVPRPTLMIVASKKQSEG